MPRGDDCIRRDLRTVVTGCARCQQSNVETPVETHVACRVHASSELHLLPVRASTPV